MKKRNQRRWKVAETGLAQVMAQVYGISPQGIAETVVLVDARPRFLYKGSQTPKSIDRLLHGKNAYNAGRGSVIRLGTRFRDKTRTSYEVNYTLAHELEHVAQHDRHDPRIFIGNILIWGLAALGAFAGSRFNMSVPFAVLASIFGAVVGMEVGYNIAPHELQARHKARQVSPLLIRHSDNE